MEGPAPPPPVVVDPRTDPEKHLADTQANYFQNLMDQPDFGYVSNEASLDPIYARAKDQYKQGVEGAAADQGFGALRNGPATSLTARGFQQMDESRLANTVARKDAWKNFVISGGRTATIPSGQVVVPGMPGPSPFSQLIGPLLTGAGFAVGGPLGAAAGAGASRAFNFS